MKNLISCLALAGTLSLAATSAVLSEDIKNEATNIVRLSAPIADNAEQRINYSGKLRMLSQRIPSAACYYNNGIEMETTSALLKRAPDEFEKILSALEFGDPDLNIVAPETNGKTLKRIHDLRAEWEPLKAAVDAIAAGTASETDIDFVLTQSRVVLEGAASLVPQLVKQYSNPNAIPHAQLMLVDLAGRQRMLTQKIAKEACMLATQSASTDTAAELENTMSIFEASLEALRFGMAEVGIQPPPNDLISIGLEVVLQDWQGVKPVLTQLLDGDALDDPASTLKFNSLNDTMANMNTVVVLYADAIGTGS
jgi:hypothetical protein